MSKVQIIFLGGLDEIGKNMMALRCGDSIIVIDCGLKFASEDLFGIEYVVPDFSYLISNKNLVKAIIITHGHEDHIGGLPFFLQQFNVPVYGTNLTLGLIEEKLKDFHFKGAKLKKIDRDSKLAIGPFNVSFMRVCHSIADGVGLNIETPAGRIIHSGDFKIDYTPVNDEYMDLDRFAAAGESGVLLLMSDSTNSDIPGITPSEKTVGATFDKVFGSATGRIIVASFASNIHRIQQVIDTAKKYDRKVAISGHSMQVAAAKARQRGFLKCASSDLIDLEEIKDVHHTKLVVMTTGSQGEPMSALARMGRGEHQHVKISKGDTVLISAIAIPGNEKYVDQTIDNLFRRGAEVIYEERLGVHVSGHGAEEELKLILSLVRPKFFIPIHGEYRHLVRHTKLAHQVGLKPVNTLVAENGDIVELSRDNLKRIKNTNAEPVMITGRRISNIGRAVMRERKILAEEGIIYITVVLSKKGQVVLGFPEINTNGFVFVKESEKLMSKIKEVVMHTLGQAAKDDINKLKSQIKEDLGRFLAQEEHRHPTIVPVVIEV